MIGYVAVAGALALAGCGGDEEGDLEAFCDRIVEFDDAPDPFQAAARDDLDGAADALAESQAMLGDLVELAPEEIRPDVEATADYFDDFAAQAQEASSPNDFLRIATTFQQENEGFVDSTERIGEFTGENCPEPTAAEG